MDMDYIRAKTMDTRRKTLQCSICQKTYSRKDNLLRKSNHETSWLFGSGFVSNNVR